MSKIIFAESYVSSGGGYNDYDEQPDTNVNIKVCDSVAELVKIPEVRKELIAAGWQPVEELKKIQDKVVLKDKYYIRVGPIGYFHELDVTDITNNDVKQLAMNDSGILQEVTLKSVLSDEQYKIVAAAQKKRENMEKARVAGAKAKAENAAQRKLDKAKKLLEEHEKKVAELQKKVK